MVGIRLKELFIKLHIFELFTRRDYGDVADGHQRILLHVEVDVPHIGSVCYLIYVVTSNQIKEIIQNYCYAEPEWFKQLKPCAAARLVMGSSPIDTFVKTHTSLLVEKSWLPTD